jgi:NAD(P)-dependent dehydrogenase (short-subunit alcohol dehydrogenase family)
VAHLAGEQGYAVCISYLNNRVAAEAVVTTIRQNNGQAMAVQADVALEDDVVRLFKEVDATFGALSALVNNAGVLAAQARVDEMDSARIQRIFATNVIGSFICAREAVRRMSTRHGGVGGAIVNLSSRAARLGAPGEYVDYAASKAAIDTLTIGLSKEVAAEGIRVNAVSPGIIYTDIHASGGEPQRVDRVKDAIPMKRGGYPEEVAKAVLWLLSEDASYTTGATLDVAGGR